MNNVSKFDDNLLTMKANSLLGPAKPGTERVDTWLSRYCGADDTPYVRAVGARFLISAIARALDPGCRMDAILVLHGARGTGKSMTVSILGSPWSTQMMLLGRDKDLGVVAGTNWIIEVTPLTVNDIDKHEAFLFRRYDKFRPTYGRTIEEFPRRCVFVGTDSRADWRDATMRDRRYWPVHIRECDTEALQRDRDQLWAEAAFRYHSAILHPELAHPDCPGERWWFEPDEQIGGQTPSR